MDTSDDKFPKLPPNFGQPATPDAAEVALAKLEKDAAQQALKKFEELQKATLSGPIDINQMAQGHLLKDRPTK